MKERYYDLIKQRVSKYMSTPISQAIGIPKNTRIAIPQDQDMDISLILQDALPYGSRNYKLKLHFFNGIRVHGTFVCAQRGHPGDELISGDDREQNPCSVITC